MKRKTIALFISLLLVGSFVFAMGEKSVDKSAVDEPIVNNIIIEMKSKSDDKFEHGKEAHKDHCYKCHSDDVYTRDNRFVNNIEELGKQVVRCKDGSNVPWFEEDTETVIHFVNKKFYNF